MLTEEQILDEINKINYFMTKNRNYLENWNKLRLESMIEAYRNVINDRKTTLFTMINKRT